MNQSYHAFGTQPAAAGTRMHRMARVFAALAARRGGRQEQERDAERWLSPREPLVLAPSDRRTITCEAGTVWITQGDTADYVLEAGQSLALRPAGEVVVTAMKRPARIRQAALRESRSPAAEQERDMHELTRRERELVALGAAFAGNCAPCMEAHIPAAQHAGLSARQIAEAIRIAGTVRQVPASGTLSAAAT